MERCCITCRWFRDAHYSKTYISPMCTQRGTDSAVYMRLNVCGVDEARLYEPKEITSEIGYVKPKDQRGRQGHTV